MFFHQRYCGVRTSGGMTDKNPAEKDPRFVAECRNLLIKQIRLQQPKLIIALGKYAIEFLAPLVKATADLSKIKTFVQLDIQELSGLKNVIFEQIDEYKTNIAFVTHPCIWHGNVWRRKFATNEGLAAEVQLVKQLKTF